MNNIKKTDKELIMPWVSTDTIVNEISPLDKKGRLSARQLIDKCEADLQSALGSETGCMDEINDNGLREHFIEGAYVRELFIPAGTAIVSRIWNKTRMWIIAAGEVTFTTEMGTQRVKAPFTKIVPHGSKVVLYTHEDTLWFAVTGASATNSDDVEKEVIANDYSDCNYPWIGEDK